MNKKSLATIVAIAACSTQLSVAADAGKTIVLQVMPAGSFRALDGRPQELPGGWFIDSAIAASLIARFEERKSQLVIDYEHQTLHKEKNGQPAPAAAWITSLEWREGQGLYATAELTDRALAAVTAKPPEYRYFSPVFTYHSETGAPLELLMGAITNTPAVDDLDELTLLAAASFQLSPTPEEAPVKKLLACVIAGLALAENTTEDQAVAALTAHLKKDPLAGLRTALGAADDADESALVAACSSLKTSAEAANPDPTKFVPVAVVKDLQTEIAALNARFKQADEDSLDATIDAAVEKGQLIGDAMVSWARDLGKKDLAALNQYLASAAPVAALSQSQTQGKARVDTATGLTETELAVCTQLGLTAEQYKASKPSA